MARQLVIEMGGQTASRDSLLHHFFRPARQLVDFRRKLVE